MQKYFALIAAFLLLPLSAQAGSWSYDVSGTAHALYGHRDVSTRYKHKQNNEKAVGYAELNLSTEYKFDEDTNLGLYVDVMKNANRSTRTLNNGSWGKEVYGIFNSSYGRLMIGETYNIAHQFHQSEENILSPTNLLTNPNWNRKENRVFFKTLTSTSIDTDGVAPKITYITPGFKDTYLGVSYINNINNRRGLVNKQLSYQNNEGYVASIYNEFDAYYFDIYSSIAYAEFHGTDKEISASLKLKRGNWNLSSGYHKAYIDGKKYGISADLSDNYREGYAWDVGLGYEFGPFTGTLTYLNSKSDNTDNEDRLITLSGKYQHNKYLDFYLGASHVDYQGQDNNISNNNKGYIFITGLGVNF